MAYPIPGYLTPFILTGMAGIIITVVLGLRSALQHAPSSEKVWAERDGTKAFWTVTLLLVSWFAVAYATSSAGLYSPGGHVPTIQYGLFVPMVLGALLFRFWPLLRRTLALIPNTWMVGVQVYRALGVIFLLLYAGRHLPGLFALPAGIGDVSVGLLAPFVASAYSRSPETAAQRVRLWNLFGIADLVVAVTMGFLTAPSLFQIAAFDLPSQLIGEFPLVLIPVFAVPLSILFHVASLLKLRQEQARAASPALTQQVRPSAIG